MIKINQELFKQFELNPATDIDAILKYGRSVKAFKTNRLRAEATRLIERRLGLTQREFAKVKASVRLEMVHKQTRILVNQLGVRQAIRRFNEGI